jgi:hypothetical protein
MRDASDTVRIREQSIVQIVEVQNGELMNSALAAAAQQDSP